MRRITWLLTAVTLVLTACGPAASVTDVGAAPTSADTRPSVTERVTATPSAAAPTASSSTDATEPAAATSGGDDALPGAPVDWPAAAVGGAEIGVLGVEADDVLNVRARPGAGQPIVDRLDPLRRGIVFTGDARQVGDAVWPEITVDGTTGWVNGRYVQLIAGTDDITAEILDDGPLTAATMRELADEVVDAYGLTDGYRIIWGPDRDPAVGAEAQRRIVVSDGPRVGDPAVITLDVLDLFDDSVAAERLVIFAVPFDGGGRFSVSSVERTFFCWRGGADLCV